MAVKTFTTGEVLTASDTNTYLANAGLVYITSTTFTGSTTVDILNCFSATYDDYRVHVNIYGSAATYAKGQFLDSTTPSATGYYKAGFTLLYNSAALTAYTAANETAIIPIAQYGTTAANSSMSVMDIFGPALARNTNYQINIQDPNAIERYDINGTHASTTTYEGLRVFGNSGTISGTITVYGYRKA